MSEKKKVTRTVDLPDPSKSLEFIGRFYIAEPFRTEDARTRLIQIHEYYTDDKIRDMLLPLIDRHTRVSLRALDWLVANYSKKHNVVYKWKPYPDQAEQLINVHGSYRDWLPRWRRKVFDSFRRHHRVYFVFEGTVHETTVAQLNFLRWADMYGVLNYLSSNLEAISQDMFLSTHRLDGTGSGSGSSSGIASQSKPSSCPPSKPVLVGKRRRRRELSKAPKDKCFIYTGNVLVRFLNTNQDDLNLEKKCS